VCLTTLFLTDRRPWVPPLAISEASTSCSSRALRQNLIHDQQLAIAAARDTLNAPNNADDVAPPGAPAAPDQNAALAAALNAIAIATALANLNQPAPAQYAALPVLDHFSSIEPFDLASRAASTAFTSAYSPLDETWDGTDAKGDFANKKLPPFVKHFRSSPANDATVYKAGNWKTWNNTTWYYCHCPTHRDKVKWHTHPTDTWRTRQRWKEGKTNIFRAAAIAPTEDKAAEPSAFIADTPTDDITAFLASGMNLTGDNDIACEWIAITDFHATD
jgi:hypothetical protein